MATLAQPITRLGLRTLPAELRSKIWNAVGQREDFSSLLLTDRMIRHEILSMIPGALLSCACPSTRPCSCGKGFEVDQLTIIVEPDCPERRWLKFAIRTAPGRGACVWSVANLDSRLARSLRYCRPREIIIDFRAPIINAEECRLEQCYSYLCSSVVVAIITLRAKLFDVCEVLEWFQPQRDRSLKIRFTELWSQPRGELFWHLGLQLNLGFTRQKLIETDPFHVLLERTTWGFSERPVYYAILLVPLCLNWAWRNAEVVFDQEPGGYRAIRHGELTLMA